MDISVNKIDINIGKAGAAALVPAAGIIFAIFEPSARIATSAIAGVFALLIVGTLWKGGTVAFPGVTLSGYRPPVQPPTLGAAAPAEPPQRAFPPTLPPDTPSIHAGKVIGFAAVLAAGAIIVGLLASTSHAAASPSAAPGKARPSGPADMAMAYYKDINERDWPQAWQLAHGQSRDYGTAYQQWVDGYNCTVQDHVTRITAKGDSLLVFVRAQEAGGVIQNYEFSYVVRRGILTQPKMLSYTGHAPKGCG
jgi:hypothetical protein